MSSPFLQHPTRLLSLRPIPVGEEAPPISLTAEEGTWIKSQDFRGYLNLVLVFFGSLKDDSTDDYLRSLQKARERFEQLDTVIFGVSQFRTDQLRDYRSRFGLEFHLLYDPLAVTARRYGCSGRLRPYCKPSVVVVGKDGKVTLARRGWVEVEELLAHVAGLEGKEVPPQAEERVFTGVRDPGAPKDDARRVSAARAAEMLQEEDSPYVLLDVRTEAEFESLHVPGSHNIPMDELPHRYQELGQTTHILCISQTGGMADAAAEFLTSVGCSSVYVVEDGIAAWTGPMEGPGASG